MKRSGDLVVLIAIRHKFSTSSLLQKWCRHLSSLRSALEHRELKPFIAREVVWGPPQGWENPLDKHFKVGEALLIPTPYAGNVQGTKTVGAGDVDYQPGFFHEPHHERSRGLAKCEWAVEDGSWSKFWEETEISEAIEVLHHLVRQRCFVPHQLFYHLLKRCIAERDSLLGRQIHILARRSGYESNTFVANHIIRMYASHGRLQEAVEVFTKVSAPDSFMWHSIISAHADRKQPMQAVKLYRQMQNLGVKANSYIFVAVLKASAITADLSVGKPIHSDILRSEVEIYLYIGSSLVDMYAKCGSLEDARRVFDHLPSKNVVTWNAMITGYTHHGLGQEALDLYASMQKEGITPSNRVTFLCLLKACASVKALHQGTQLHSQIHERGLEGDMTLGNGLVDMYAKCGSLSDARRLFDNLPVRDVVTWNAIIAGYAQEGLCLEALTLYEQMELEGATANHFTLACLLKVCASLGAVRQGKQLHAQIQNLGLEADLVVGSSLVDMYVKCGRVDDARRVFDKLPARDVVTWTALINGYGQSNDCQKAIECFQEMQLDGVEPDEATFLCLLVACSHEGLVKEGQRYFSMMLDNGIMPTVYHHNCMVDLLGRAGHLDEAEDALLTMPFDSNVVGWMSLLSACRSHFDIERGRRCFHRVTTLEPQNAAAYVHLASMLADAGRWRDMEEIESLRKAAGACKKSASATIEVNSTVHNFVVGEERDDISSKLRSLNLLWEDGAHVPHTELVLSQVPRRQQEDAICGHAEKLALAYGLLNTPSGETLIVNKNLRMCKDCHDGTKALSTIEKREIIVRDAHRVHRFVDGSCSCGDHP